MAPAVGKFTTLAVDTVKLNLMTDTVTYNTIRPKALFYRMTKSPNNPALLDWEVGNLTSYVGVEETHSDMNTPALSVYPNPFRNHLVINLQIPVDKVISSQYPVASIKIYDAAGRLVRNLLPTTNSLLSTNTLIWTGDDELGRKVPDGVYFIRLESDNTKITEKAILLR